MQNILKVERRTGNVQLCVFVACYQIPSAQILPASVAVDAEQIIKSEHIEWQSGGK